MLFNTPANRNSALPPPLHQVNQQKHFRPPPQLPGMVTKAHPPSDVAMFVVSCLSYSKWLPTAPSLLTESPHYCPWPPCPICSAASPSLPPHRSTSDRPVSPPHQQRRLNAWNLRATVVISGGTADPPLSLAMFMSS